MTAGTRQWQLKKRTNIEVVHGFLALKKHSLSGNIYIAVTSIAGIRPILALDCLKRPVVGMAGTRGPQIPGALVGSPPWASGTAAPSPGRAGQAAIPAGDSQHLPLHLYFHSS